MRLYSYGTNPHMCRVEEVYVQLGGKRVLDLDGSLKRVTSYWEACASASEFLPYYLGRIRDAHQYFPEVDGFLNDGPEFGYEIAPGFMAGNWDLFACFGPCCASKARELGYDFEDMKGAVLALMQGLHRLDVSGVNRMLEGTGAPLEALSLKTWNPHLPEGPLLRFVCRLFGFELPEVESLEDIARHIDGKHLGTTALTHQGAPFPREFFTRVVAGQVRKMIAQIGDAGRVRPWLDSDHGGRALTPHELDLTLTAAESAGLKTYLYYCPLESGTWEVAVKHGKRK